MKSKKMSLIILIAVFATFTSCKKDDLSVLGGSQSPIGEVGHSISWGPIQGVTVQGMTVTKLDGGVSTFSCSGSTTNSTYIDLLKMVPTERFPGTVTISGNSVNATVNAKITDEGAQVVFTDGTALTLVNYNGNVGDKYTAKVGSVTLENEIIEKSTDDDFYWGGMYIKVIKVRYTSHAPGILHVDAIYNHKFALVGVDIYFEDGTVKRIGCSC